MPQMLATNVSLLREEMGQETTEIRPITLLREELGRRLSEGCFVALASMGRYCLLPRWK